MYLTFTSSLQTSAALQSFVLAMVLYPDAQKRAQEDIDSVLGHGHFPHFGDAEALPYLRAVLNEVLRWACPAPLGQTDPCHLCLTIRSYVVDGRCVRHPSPRNRR
jgi:cytochrome P450